LHFIRDAQCRGAADMPEALQELPKTVAAGAFKNGLAFVVRQG
jgi:hypothetical protein